jgi:hypothetical protein
MLSIEDAKKICRIEEQIKFAGHLYGAVDNDWIKYLEKDTYIDEKLNCLDILNLDKLKNQKVLDIGAGIGHFGSLCKHYGHSYLGTYFGRSSKDLLNFHKDLNLETVECALFPSYKKEIPKGPWDVIVLIRTTFDMNVEWCSVDWKELIDESLDQLNLGGQLLIKSNLKIGFSKNDGKIENHAKRSLEEAFKKYQPHPRWSYYTYHIIKE